MIKLRDYQKQAIEKLKKDECGYLRMDPGTGKTIIAIEATKKKRTLVICPKYVVLSWKAELERHYHDQSFFIVNSDNYKSFQETKFQDYNYVIIHYELLKWLAEWAVEHYHAGEISQLYEAGKNKNSSIVEQFIKKFKEDKMKESFSKFIKAADFKNVIFDEMHYLKTHNSIRTTLSKEIVKLIKNRFGLSGTLIDKNYLDAFTQLRLIFLRDYEPALKTYFSFRNYYFDRYDIKTAKATFPKFNIKKHRYEELKDKINRLVIHKSKSDLGLPPKNFITVPFQLSPKQTSSYREIVNQYMTMIEDEIVTAETAAAEREKLIQLCSGFLYLPQLIGEERKYKVFKEAMKERLDYIENLYIQTGKIVVWYYYKAEYEELKKRFKKHFTIERWPQFQEEKEAMMIINLCNPEGIQLQTASHAVFMNIPRRLSQFVQAQDRTHRIGMNDEPANYYLFYSEGTVIEKVIDQLIEKVTMSLDLYDDLGSFSSDDDLLQYYIDRHLKKIKGGNNGI